MICSLIISQLWFSCYFHSYGIMDTHPAVVCSFVTSVWGHGSDVVWLRVTAYDSGCKKKLRSFVNRCPRCILQVWWPKKVTNRRK